jgi:hypothetical protein
VGRVVPRKFRIRIQTTPNIVQIKQLKMAHLTLMTRGPLSVYSTVDATFRPCSVNFTSYELNEIEKQ